MPLFQGNLQGLNLSPFDWPKVVTQNKPGLDSADQKWRQEKLAILYADLKSWAATCNNHHPNERSLTASAYTGIINSLPPTLSQNEAASYHMALLIGKIVLWIFEIDYFIDEYIQKSYPQTPLPPDWVAGFDFQLSYILEPLNEIGFSGQEPYRPLDSEPSLKYLPEKREIAPACIGLREMIQSLYQELLSQELERGFSTLNFAGQTIKLVQAMRWELVKSYDFSLALAINRLPEWELYLEMAQISIGMPLVASTVISLEQSPEELWDAAVEAIAHSAKIIRMVNDIGGFWHELEEHKINSVTYALVKAGNSPFASYSPEDSAVSAARSAVQEIVQTEIQALDKGLEKLPARAFVYWMRNTVAFAVAMYEKGNYVAPE